MLLYERIKGTYSAAFLTLISIIQGAAFSYFIAVVSTGYQHFGFTQWMLALNTFLLIVEFWNEAAQVFIAYVWIPNIFDVLLPFLNGALEAFIVLSVTNMPHWFLGMAVLAFVAFFYFLRASRRIHAESEDNARVIETMRQWGWLFYLAYGAGMLIFLSFWYVATYAPSLVDTEVVFPVITLGLMIGIMIFSSIYWVDFVRRIRQK
jgi:hypothetical protein